MKNLGPQKLAVDGTYGINPDHLNSSIVDIFSDHFYPMDIKKLSQGVALVQNVKKVYFAAEYAWTPEAQRSGAKIEEFFKWIEDRNAENATDPVVVGGKYVTHTIAVPVY